MTKTTVWVRLHDDGRVAEQSFDKPPAKEANGWREMDRIGDTRIETVRRGRWVPLDRETLDAAIDDSHDADHGHWRRHIDRALKEIEARVLLGDLETNGRLAREAKVRGVSVHRLAEMVVAKADASDVETGRIAAKVKKEQ